MQRLQPKWAAVIALVLLSAADSSSYIRTPVSQSIGAPVQWNLANPDTKIVSGGRITYNINSAGSDDVPFSSVESALAASFQTWEDIPTSSVAFARGPATTSTSTASDGQFQIFWLENSTTTVDGVSLAGILALSRITNYTSGLRTGEIIDASLVFNGNQYKWSVTGAAGSADIQDIATHEIGHIIGLGHSPIGGATMFPRSLIGSRLNRTLSEDDLIAASVAYAAPGFLASRGTLRGRVRDNTGRNIFGAHVTAVNSSGIPVSGAITVDDGSYAIQGLPAGSYTVYAEPLDSAAGAFCSKFDLPGYYASIFTDFQTSQDYQAAIAAGGTTSVDIAVNRGNPDFDGQFVSDVTGLAFRNIPLAVAPGSSNISVGVSGPAMPQNFNIGFSGSGITVLRTYFRTLGGGYNGVYADINVSSSAAAGPRNIVISSGSQRTIVTGGLEIAPELQPPVAVVSSASYVDKVAAESIIAAFGSNLSTQTASSGGGGPATSLGGTTVRIRDAAGNERLSPLFYVSPGQINCQIAPGVTIGPATMTVINGSGQTTTTGISIDAVAPGIFTADSSGQGLAAAMALRVKPNNAQTYEPIASYDSVQKKFNAIPIDLGPSSDQVFLVLFGTGIRFRGSLPTVSIGGVNCQVTYAGRHDSFIGLDQINVRIDRSLAGRGLVNVLTAVDGKQANTVTAAIR